MIDFTKGIFQSGPFLKVYYNGNWCNINEAEYPQAWTEVQAWLAAHPEYIVAEDRPPEPTPEERAAQRRAAIIGELNALDARAVQYIRATIDGTIDKEGISRYEANKKSVKELKAELQTLK